MTSENIILFSQRVLPIIVTIQYIIVSIAFLSQKKYGWALAWFAYSIANIGLVIASIEQSNTSP